MHLLFLIRVNSEINQIVHLPILSKSPPPLINNTTRPCTTPAGWIMFVPLSRNKPDEFTWTCTSVFAGSRPSGAGYIDLRPGRENKRLMELLPLVSEPTLNTPPSLPWSYPIPPASALPTACPSCQPTGMGFIKGHCHLVTVAHCLCQQPGRILWQVTFHNHHNVCCIPRMQVLLQQPAHRIGLLALQKVGWTVVWVVLWEASKYRKTKDGGPAPDVQLSPVVS